MEDISFISNEPEDSDRIPSTKRYWKESNGMICSICLEPDHQARNCDHQLCLTCGAIDEHNTRQCPVSLVCYDCGSRGHLSRHCPSATKMSRDPCGRCGSPIHLTLNCPSIWRCYEEEDPPCKPQRVVPACYYCGDTGDHFGDECPFRRPTHTTEPSAFSSRSLSKSTEYSSRSHRPRGIETHSNHRDRDRSSGRQIDSYRPDDPTPERSKGRIRPGRRDRAAYARQAEAHDEDDWFSKRQQKQPSKSKPPTDKQPDPKSNRIGGSYKGGYLQR